MNIDISGWSLLPVLGNDVLKHIQAALEIMAPPPTDVQWVANGLYDVLLAYDLLPETPLGEHVQPADIVASIDRLADAATRMNQAVEIMAKSTHEIATVLEMIASNRKGLGFDDSGRAAALATLQSRIFEAANDTILPRPAGKKLSATQRQRVASTSGPMHSGVSFSWGMQDLWTGGWHRFGIRIRQIARSIDKTALVKRRARGMRFVTFAGRLAEVFKEVQQRPATSPDNQDPKSRARSEFGQVFICLWGAVGERTSTGKLVEPSNKEIREAVGEWSQWKKRQILARSGADQKPDEQADVF